MSDLTGKIARKVGAMKGGVGIPNDTAIHNVNVYVTDVPTTIDGILVNKSDTFVTIRHRKRASRKTRQTTFTTEQVITVFGSVGELSRVTVLSRQLLQKLRGTVKYSKTRTALSVTGADGHKTVVNIGPRTDVEVFADEDEKAQSVKKSARREAASKKSDEDTPDKSVNGKKKLRTSDSGKRKTKRS